MTIAELRLRCKSSDARYGVLRKDIERGKSALQQELARAKAMVRHDLLCLGRLASVHASVPAVPRKLLQAGHVKRQEWQ